MKNDSDQRIVEKILKCADLDNKHVLEIGCGNGRITSLMVGIPEKLIAIEPDLDHIREARKRVSGVEFRIGSGENLEFSDKYFDVVIFTLSLHHQDSKAAIREASRVLKDGGKILTIEPINEGEVERIFALIRNENHETLDAQKSIKDSGLTIESSEIFTAKWMFDNREDLFRSIFEYYDVPFDTGTAIQISDLLGAKLESLPIVLLDTMIIQSLKKVD